MEHTIRSAFETATVLYSAFPATRARLMSCARLAQTERGGIVFHERQDLDSIHILVKGAAALYKIAADGEKKILLLLRAGSLLNEGALSSRLSGAACEILAPSLLLIIPVKEFMSAMTDDFSLVRAVLASMNQKISRLEHHLKNTPNAVVGEKKLAAKLYKLARDFGRNQTNGTVIDLDISITCLADMLGQKRETVSRQFGTLRRLGLATLENHRILIPDLKRLTDFFHGV